MKSRLPVILLVIAFNTSGLWALSNDGDLLSDVWEVAYGFNVMNGFFPTGELATDDPDGDDQSNLAESLAGIDPYDASKFSIGAIQTLRVSTSLRGDFRLLRMHS